MRCPVCKTSNLVTEPLEGDLLTMRCPECGGHWVKSFQYWRWREQQPDTQAVVMQSGPSPEADSDSRPGKLCPECGRFLSHRPVGHGVTFSLDRCGHCGGMWFDQAEWDTLKSRSLHQDAHFVFTDAWQAELREVQRIDSERGRLKAKLGDKDYNELLQVGRWLNKHPHRAILLAVLGDNDMKKLIEAD